MQYVYVRLHSPLDPVHYPSLVAECTHCSDDGRSTTEAVLWGLGADEAKRQIPLADVKKLRHAPWVILCIQAAAGATVDSAIASLHASKAPSDELLLVQHPGSLGATL